MGYTPTGRRRQDMVTATGVAARKATTSIWSEWACPTTRYLQCAGTPGPSLTAGKHGMDITMCIPLRCFSTLTRTAGLICEVSLTRICGSGGATILKMPAAPPMRRKRMPLPIRLTLPTTELMSGVSVTAADRTATTSMAVLPAIANPIKASSLPRRWPERFLLRRKSASLRSRTSMPNTAI